MAAVTATSVVNCDGRGQNKVKPEILELLADYEIHKSTPQEGDEDGMTLVGGHTMRQRQPEEFDPSLAAHPTVPYEVTNPAWWESSYRRVPVFRPVNRRLDLEERRQNPLFQTVGFTMIFGCMTIAVGLSGL